MKKLILFTFSVFSFVLSFGQNITGSLSEENSADPIVSAKVTLMGAVDTFATGSDFNGQYFFKKVKNGKYVLKIESYNHVTTFRDITMEGKNILVPKITLKIASQEIEEIDLSGQQIRVEQKGDTTSYNAEAFKTNPNATAQDLVKKIPGVTVQNGEVQSEGEKVQKVLVDGKPFFGNDPNTALNTLPAEAVSKVEVFDDESEKSKQTGFSDGNTQKTMNIVTKPGMNKGVFGRVTAGYGTDNKYRASGSYNIFNGDQRISIIAQSNNINQQNFSSEDLLGVSASSGGGGFGRGPRGASSSSGDFMVGAQGGITQTHAFGFNYQDKWGESTDFVGSYFFNYSDNYNLTNTNRNYFPSRDVTQRYTSNDSLGSINMNHRFNVRLSSDVTKKDRILFLPRFSFQENSGYNYNDANTTQNDAMVNGLNNDFSTDYNAFTFDGELYYTHKFDKKGRQFNIQIEGSTANQNGDNQQWSLSSFLQNGILVTDTLDQTATLKAPNNSFQSGVSFTEPIGENSSVMVEYEYEQNLGGKNQITFYSPNQNGLGYLIDTALSNDFDSRFTTHQVGLSYQYRLGRKFFFVASLNGQSTGLDNEILFPKSDNINKTYHNILPRFFTRYAIGKNHRIMAGYRSSTDIPSVGQLQNVVNNNNPLQLTTGNPLLDQQYSHSFFSRYNFTNEDKTKQFSIYLSTQFANNYIANQSFITESDTVINGVTIAPGSQISSPINLSGYRSSRTFISYSMPFNWLSSNLNFSLNGSESKIPGKVNGQTTFTENQGLGFGVGLTSNISEKVDFTVSSNTGISWVKNPNQPITQYSNQSFNVKLDWIFYDGWSLHNNLSYQIYGGYSESFDNQFTLWNLGIGKYILKDRGEITLSVYDLLNQNNSISQTATETYIEEKETLALRQYFMLSFTYNLTDFSPPKKEEFNYMR